jgi:hypothetical protein
MANFHPQITVEFDKKIFQDGGAREKIFSDPALKLLSCI